MFDIRDIAEKREIMQIALPDAQKVLRSGMEYFIGPHFQWLPSYEKVARWLADNQKRGLMLSGGNGVGKTVFCTKVLPLIFRYYLHIEDVTIIDAKYLGDYYKNPSDYYKIVYDKNPIIIDDVGVEDIANDYGERRDIFSEIVDDAEKRARLIVFTTNLYADDIKTRYGMRTLDRLYSIVRSICIEGQSMRLKTI